MDCRPFATIEHSPVNRRAIGSSGHQPIEHVQLTDEMSLADTADRGIAAHLTNIFPTEGQQSDARPTACRCSSCLAASMPRTYYENVKHVQALRKEGADGQTAVFHVEHLLAEAKTSEQCIQDVLHPRRTSQPVQR